MLAVINKHVSCPYCVRSPVVQYVNIPLYPITTIFRHGAGSDFISSIRLSLPLSGGEHFRQTSCQTKENSLQDCKLITHT